MRRIHLAAAVALVFTATQAAAQTVSVPSSITVAEGLPWSVPVTRVGPKNVTLSFAYRTLDGSAIAGQDYTARSGSQSVRKNATKYTLSGPTIDDQVHEGDESFVLEVTPKGQPAFRTTITIKDNDAAPAPEPQPEPVLCPDGSTVIPPATCPELPPPATPPGDIFAVDINGLAPIVAYPDPSGGLDTWSFEHNSAAPDVVGAVRLTCGFAGVGYFDPKVFPGDHTGKSHLHQFYGNVSVTPDSTYESLRRNGKSTCNYGDVTVQRSAYWQPAMLDGKGNVVQPDHTTLYYKRRPLTDPVISAAPGTPITPLRSTDQKFAEGKGVDLPNGLFFIFGFDMLTGTPPTGNVQFGCYPPGGAAAITAKTIKAIADTGQCVAGSQFVTRGEGPHCWDGKRVDSANHRDHMAYPSYGSWGYPRCPLTHPFVTPTITLLSSWIIQPGDDLNLWSVSSDAMRPDLPAGSTIHFDIWPLWEPAVLKLGERGCMDLLLNCSSGRLNETIALKNAGQPQYPDATGKLVKSWANPRRLIPIPGPEANDKMVGFAY